MGPRNEIPRNVCMVMAGEVWRDSHVAGPDPTTDSCALTPRAQSAS